jgi:hypothetical protein
MDIIKRVEQLVEEEEQLRAQLVARYTHSVEHADLRTLQMLSALNVGYDPEALPLPVRHSKGISEHVEEILAWATTKGWDDKLCETKASVLPAVAGHAATHPEVHCEPTGVNTDAVLAKLALVVSEIAEGIEHVRLGQYTVRDAEIVVPPMPPQFVRLARRNLTLRLDSMLHGDDVDDVLKYFDAYYDDDGNVKRPEHPKPDGLVVEMADAIIRLCHLAGDLGLPLEEAVEMKMAYNQKRSYRHGGKLA